MRAHRAAHPHISVSPGQSHQFLWQETISHTGVCPHVSFHLRLKLSLPCNIDSFGGTCPPACTGAPRTSTPRTQASRHPIRARSFHNERERIEIHLPLRTSGWERSAGRRKPSPPLRGVHDFESARQELRCKRSSAPYTRTSTRSASARHGYIVHLPRPSPAPKRRKRREERAITHPAHSPQTPSSLLRVTRDRA
jgi:hypothetical protein